MIAPAPAMTRRAVTRRLPRVALDGGALSVRAWLLLAPGTAGGLVFTGVHLAEGATRAGYRTLAQPISALSLGPGGWVQQLNFIVSACWCACRSRAGGRHWHPAGAHGYPPGARAGVPTVHGQVHTLFAMITITALASGCFVLARRFAAESGWRCWAVFAVAAGLVAIVFIAAFGAAGGHGGLAGRWERAAGGATSVLTVAVLARLAAASRPAARACLPGPAAGEVA